MIVVDAMRFPVHRGGRHRTAGSPAPRRKANQHFLVPAAPAVPGRPRRAHARRDPAHSIRATATPSRSPCRPRTTGNYGQSGGSRSPADITRHSTTPLACPTTAASRDQPPASHRPAYHAVPPINEPWDYFPFNDRDFTSVAELLMVPGCPPGLFTKQFAEFAPSSANVTNIFSKVTPLASPLASTQLTSAAGRSVHRLESVQRRCLPRTTR